MKKLQTKTTVLVLVALVAMLGVTACDKKAGGAACEQVTAHMNNLMVSEAPEAERAAAKASLVAGLATTIAECKTRNMSADSMNCLLAAKSTADFAKCK